MQKSFKIGKGGNDIIKADKAYDLHNLYDFVGVILKTKDRYLQLLFSPNSEYGEKEPPVLLNFEDVDYLEFSPDFGTRTLSGLAEIGYKNPEDRDDDWLLNEEQAASGDHLFFRMDGDEFVRLHCRYADLIEEAKE
ncbi:MAG: hypothetical protein EA357_01630 [Micavibrio sp.]|nr:MAG: hypothetical protein EA357_01630 [Micavibrio sp.]